MRFSDMSEGGLSGALSEARLLHDDRAGTYFNVLSKGVGSDAGRRAGRRGYPTHMLPEIMRLSERQHRDDDFYLSQATFSARSGCATHFQSIRTLFVDLDSYKDPEGLATPEQVLEKLDRIGLPEPTYIVSSGRGQYLKYLLQDRVYAEHLHDWGLAQRALVASTASLHSDSKVKDCSRILRTLGSANRASGGRRVSVAWQGGTVYRFRDLAERIGRSAVNAVQDARRSGMAADGLQLRRHARTLRAYAELGQAQTFAFSALDEITQRHTPLLFNTLERTPQSLAWTRFLDLKELIRMRGGVREGERDLCLFWMMNLLAASGTVHPGNFYDEVAAIASLMPGTDFEPLQDGSMETLYRRVEAQAEGKRWRQTARQSEQPDGQGPNGKTRNADRSPLYQPSNDFLIETFRIEPAEQRALRTIISRDIVNERRVAKRRAAGVQPMAEVIATRRHARESSAQTARVLVQQGASLSSIAIELMVSERTVRRYLAPSAASPGTHASAAEIPAPAARPSTRHMAIDATLQPIVPHGILRASRGGGQHAPRRGEQHTSDVKEDVASHVRSLAEAGRTGAAIARELGISERTVWRHLARHRCGYSRTPDVTGDDAVSSLSQLDSFSGRRAGANLNPRQPDNASTYSYRETLVTTNSFAALAEAARREKAEQEAKRTAKVIARAPQRSEPRSDLPTLPRGRQMHEPARAQQATGGIHCDDGDLGEREGMAISASSVFNSLARYADPTDLPHISAAGEGEHSMDAGPAGMPPVSSGKMPGVGGIGAPGGMTPDDRARLERLREMQDRAARRQLRGRASDPNDPNNVVQRGALEEASDAQKGAAHAVATSPVDPVRPRGSRFSLEAWEAARASQPGCCIFEFQRINPVSQQVESILMALPHERVVQQGLPLELLDGSLVAPRIGSGGVGATNAVAGGESAAQDECRLNFHHWGFDGCQQVARMRIVLREANPNRALFAGCTFDLALGPDAREVLDQGLNRSPSSRG
ncbi:MULTISPECIES: hypothetical protein [unclassified Burkholderia]|uniref:hypothetical protein n=1 Tax=unclassified Burkholderia TaxID=2613784 RepID=UPI002AB25766|nr:MULTISPECIES: hypothetical protein [unclassified Burkholderia]